MGFVASLFAAGDLREGRFDRIGARARELLEIVAACGATDLR